MGYLILAAVLTGCAALPVANDVGDPQPDAGSLEDSAVLRDAGHDAGVADAEVPRWDAGIDAGADAGIDAGIDSGRPDAGVDAGSLEDWPGRQWRLLLLEVSAQDPAGPAYEWDPPCTTGPGCLDLGEGAADLLVGTLYWRSSGLTQSFLNLGSPHYDGHEIFSPPAELRRGTTDELARVSVTITDLDFSATGTGGHGSNCSLDGRPGAHMVDLEVVRTAGRDGLAREVICRLADRPMRYRWRVVPAM